MSRALEASEKMDGAARDHRAIAEAVAYAVEAFDETLRAPAVIGFEEVELRRSRGREARKLDADAAHQHAAAMEPRKQALGEGLDVGIERAWTPEPGRATLGHAVGVTHVHLDQAWRDAQLARRA